MTYTPLQLDIIREFGRKELTEGCIIITSQCNSDGTPLCNIKYWNFGGIEYEEYSILGHIPHLEDLFRVAEEKNINVIVYQWINHIVFNDRSNNEREIKRIHYNPTLPLLDQDESTLTQLLNLLGK